MSNHNDLWRYVHIFNTRSTQTFNLKQMKKYK